MSIATVAADALPPLTGARVFTAWQVDPWLLAGLTLVGGLYVAGVARLVRRGVRWPAGRTVAFLVGGLGTIVVATMSSLGTYDDTLLTVHMVQHMVLAMVSPVFLALGAPITLLLRAAGPAVRHRTVAVLHSRVARLVTWPPIAWLHFVALPFVLYETAWYGATLRHDSLHELLHVQFVAAGCIFFFPLLGLDPMPRRLGHPARMMMAFLALPFHAFLGLSIMMRTGLIAGDWYGALHRTWGPTLQDDQSMAGGVLWGSGDFVTLLLFSVLFFQWVRADERKARQDDRRLARAEQPVAPRPAPAGSPGQAEEPVLMRPWWEVDPGPLADRMKREGWARGPGG